MDFLQAFENVMEKTVTIALATSLNDAPNVRIVTIYHDTQNNGVIYFPTFRHSPKTKELSLNNKVAFTTIQAGHDGVVRVTNATVQKSDRTVDDIKDGIIKKYPGFRAIAENEGPMLDIYEIHFNEAIVQVGHNNTGSVTL